MRLYDLAPGKVELLSWQYGGRLLSLVRLTRLLFQALVRLLMIALLVVLGFLRNIALQPSHECGV